MGGMPDGDTVFTAQTTLTQLRLDHAIEYQILKKIAEW